MTIYGDFKSVGNVWIPPDVLTFTVPLSQPFDYAQLLEQLTEEAVLAGQTVVVNCYASDRRRQILMEKAGTVPLRWGARRVLLVTPKQAKTLEEGDELFRTWRLWRYKFDPKSDVYIVGKPSLMERRIKRNIAEGRNWYDGFNLPLEVA